MTRYSKTMSEALQEVSERASAKRDAMKAMGKNKGIDPADVDTDASDDDKKAASKNILMQLRKSVSMRGNHNVEFASGKHKVDAKIAQAVQDKFMKIKRPADKQAFQDKIGKSYKDLLMALKEQYEMVEVKEEYVCEDCGCEQGNADPNCSCPNDSTDLQASYWVKKESVDEGFELEEGMKMNDPKLLKMFDKLKKGSKIKLKTSSTISQGKDYVEYIVKSKNLVNKGRVEKITLATVGNEKAVKKFLYKRDGTVGFAIGDMGASIDDIKEDFTPHMMYDPKTGKGYKAEKEADHLRMKDMGYTHEKPEMDEAKSATGYEIFHKDFSSAMQHATAFAKSKGQPIKKDEIDNKVATGPKKPSKGKENSYTLETEKGKRWSVQVYNMGNKFELNMYLTSSHVPEGDMLDEAVKYQFVAIDRLGKVIGFASDEKDAKDMARRGHTMDSPSKGKGVVGRNKAKVVKLKKPMSDKQGDMMINRDFDMNKFGGETTYSVGLKEEDEPDNRPDSAKAVDQSRDDKKKTRIAQLQLQIAKATETINKLNTQENNNA